MCANSVIQMLFETESNKKKKTVQEEFSRDSEC